MAIVSRRAQQLVSFCDAIKEQIMATLATMDDWRRLIIRTDVLIAFGLVLILMLMILPVPPMMLDVFLSLNITIALLILITALYTSRALDFAIFP
ncbi:MAG: FHIPEP family type III secretion protein, partial [Desulfuromonadaceae bacterium]